MKKIYSGETIAAVILDSYEEIEVVAEALVAYIATKRTLQDPQGQVASKLYAEITAPAPA